MHTASVVKLLIAIDLLHSQKLAPDAATSADGFQQYFGIPDGLPGTTWAIKQGWMLLMSTTVLDTTGMVGLGPTMPYAVTIMTKVPAGTSWTTGSNAVTAGAAALKAAFTA